MDSYRTNALQAIILASGIMPPMPDQAERSLIGSDNRKLQIMALTFTKVSPF